MWVPNTDVNSDGIPDAFQVKLTYTPSPAAGGTLAVNADGQTALAGGVDTANGIYTKDDTSGVITEYINRGGQNNKDAGGLTTTMKTLWEHATLEGAVTTALKKTTQPATLTADMVPTATANEGYELTNWTAETPAAGTFNADTAFTANFSSTASVTFDPNGGGWSGVTTPKVVSLMAGGHLTGYTSTSSPNFPAVPTREGFVFLWWWNVAELENLNDANAKRYVGASTYTEGETVYAVWVPDTDANADGILDAFQVKFTYTPNPVEGGTLAFSETGVGLLDGSAETIDDPAVGSQTKDDATGVITAYVNRGGVYNARVKAIMGYSADIWNATSTAAQATITSLCQRFQQPATLTADLIPTATPEDGYQFGSWTEAAPEAKQYAVDTAFTANFVQYVVTLGGDAAGGIVKLLRTGDTGEEFGDAGEIKDERLYQLPFPIEVNGTAVTADNMPKVSFVFEYFKTTFEGDGEFVPVQANATVTWNVASITADGAQLKLTALKSGIVKIKVIYDGDEANGAELVVIVPGDVDLSGDISAQDSDDAKRCGLTLSELNQYAYTRGETAYPLHYIIADMDSAQIATPDVNASDADIVSRMAVGVLGSN